MPAEDRSSPSPFRHHWLLEEGTTYLNHGAFGACPRPVLEAQSRLRERMERQPLHFIAREAEGLLDQTREVLAAFVGADAEGLALMSNATEGVNTFLRAFPLAPGDQVLVTDHEYPASHNALMAVAEAAGAEVVVAQIPYPITSPEQIVEAVLARVGPKTRLAVFDHITSQTALVMPVERLVAALKERGVPSLIDGAHGPGQVPLSLSSLGVVAYAGNCHKWLCAPKGAAFLWVSPEWRERVHPLVVSHGRSSPRTDRSRFRLEFDFRGTVDPTPWLCIPEALRFLSGLLPGGMPALMAHNHLRVLDARERLAARLGASLPCPPDMVGSMACVPLPDLREGQWPPGSLSDPVYDALWAEHRIEVPLFSFPTLPRHHVRISAQAYNAPADYERLGDALEAVLARG